MSQIENEARTAIEKLLQSDPDQLFEELGMRQRQMSTEAAVAGSFDPAVSYNAAMMGPMDELRKFGRFFYNRLQQDAYELMCGTDKSYESERNKINAALEAGQTAAATALAVACVSAFGWAPAIAVVIASIVVKLFFRNAHGAMCDVWKEHLPNA